MAISRYMAMKLTAEGAERGRLEAQSKLDRVTAERDAARGRLNELLEDFQLMSEQCDRRGTQASAFEERMGDLQIQNGKLQQRLTAADERVDVLEGQLAESERKRREFVAAVKVETDQIEAKHSRCIVVPEGYAVVPIKPTKAMRDACQIAGKLPVWDAMMAAALKPTEGRGDVVGLASLSDKALSLIYEEARNKGLPS